LTIRILNSKASSNRGRAILGRLSDELSEEEFQQVCFYSTESSGILQAMEANPEIAPPSIALYPSIVPDRDVPQQAMDKAWAHLNTLVESDGHAQVAKPWWKFWG